MKPRLIILVQGTTGEGTSLSLSERKIVIEKWSEACRRYDLKLMVSVVRLAIHIAITLNGRITKCSLPAT